MKEKDEKPLPAVPQEMFAEPQAFVSDPSADPVNLMAMLAEAGITAEQIAASELVDKEILILRGKTFPSSFPGQDHAWFVMIEEVTTKARYSTVLGGQTVVDLLDAWAGLGRENPLECTLRWKEGGRFGGYYILE